MYHQVWEPIPQPSGSPSAHPKSGYESTTVPNREPQSGAMSPAVRQLTAGEGVSFVKLPIRFWWIAPRERLISR